MGKGLNSSYIDIIVTITSVLYYVHVLYSLLLLPEISQLLWNYSLCFEVPIIPESIFLHVPNYEHKMGHVCLHEPLVNM